VDPSLIDQSWGVTNLHPVGVAVVFVLVALTLSLDRRKAIVPLLIAACAIPVAQRVIIFGTQGRIEIEIPFNAPNDKPCRIWHYNREKSKEIVFEICDQYTIQGDLFSKAILHNREVPTPIPDAVMNMKVIDALFDSSKRGRWITIR